MTTLWIVFSLPFESANLLLGEYTYHFNMIFFFPKQYAAKRGFQRPLMRIYDRKVRTVPFTTPLQMGHLRSDGAHSLQTTKCPQGIKTMLTSLSMQTLQVRSSWSLLSCSSIGKSGDTRGDKQRWKPPA